MRRKVYTALLLLIFPFAELFSFPETVTGGLDLTGKRTEFSNTGKQMDSFFESLQAKVLYHFTRAASHFSMIFRSAKEEGIRKVDETLSHAGKEAVQILQEQVKKNVAGKLEEEMKKMAKDPSFLFSPEKKKEKESVFAQNDKPEKVKEKVRDQSKRKEFPPSGKKDIRQKKPDKTGDFFIVPDLPEVPDAL